MGGIGSGGAIGQVVDYGKNLGEKVGNSGLLGGAGGASGTGFAAPQQANITSPVTQDAANRAQAQTENSLAAQQGLLAALQSQNGVGLQNQTVNQGQTLQNQLSGLNTADNMRSALNQQQWLNTDLQGANGVGTQGSAIQGLQGLAAQQAATGNLYGQIAQGQGPNPALAALNQATGQNVANQAALMAGQRGAASNVGLIARQAAQQGANTQQQAVGQAATQQSQQQLGALSGLTAQQQAQAATQQAIGGLGSTQVGQQQAGVNAYAQQAQSQLAAQQAQQNFLAGQAQQQISNQANVSQQATQANLANSGQLQGSLGQYNQAQVSNQGNVNSGNAGLAQTQMQGQQGLIGGLMNSGGSALGALAAAHGGEIRKPQRRYAGGTGDIAAPQVTATPFDTTPPPISPIETAPIASATDPNQPSSSLGKFLQGFGQNMGEEGTNAYGGNTGAQSIQKGGAKLGKGIAAYAKKKNSGKQTPDDVSNNDVSNDDASNFDSPGTMMSAKGGPVHDLRGGGAVKAATSGEKAIKAGDSYDNDKIDAKLSEHEIVLPRHVTMAKDPMKASMEYLKGVYEKRKQSHSTMHADDEAEVGAPEEDDEEETAATPDDQTAEPEEGEGDEVTASPAPSTPAPTAPQASGPMVAQAAPAPVEQAPSSERPPPPDRPVGPSTPETQEITLSPTTDQLDERDRRTATDLAKGAIKPKTYHDLFAEKSTLGKIGSIFGLLVGGAGAGLSHQPNMLMEMMNKELERDLEAQQKTAQNKVSFLTLGKEISRGMADRHLIESNYNLNNMRLVAAHRLTDIANSYPPGSPQAAQAQAAAGQVKQAVDQANAMDNQKLDARLKLNRAARGQVDPVAAAIAGAVDDQKMRQLAEGQGVSGIDIGYNPGKANEEAGDTKSNRAVAQIYNDGFHELESLPFDARTYPARRASIIHTAGAKMAKQAGAQSAEMVERLMQSYMPDALDTPETKASKLRNGNNDLMANEANTPMLDQFGLKSPYPFMQKQSPKSSGGAKKSSQSAPEERNYNGKTALFDRKTKKFLGYK